MILILCLITTVTSEMKVTNIFMSRKSKSDSKPIDTGYTYNQVNNNPGTFSVFNRKISEPVLENYTELKHVLSPIQFNPMDFSEPFYKPYESSLSKRDLDYAIAKAESKYKGNFLPTKIKSDVMYERLKLESQYKPSNFEITSLYDDDYHTDYDDVRTSSRDMYDSWPYYHGPYDYDLDIEKAKDKRYALDAPKVIPVHEDLSDDIPNFYEHIFITDHYPVTTTDNPMTGHDPFFSFILNDYYEKTGDNDHLTFKGLDWGKDFYTARSTTDVGGHAVRNRRLDTYPDNINNLESNSLHGYLVTEKGYKKEHDFDKYEKGDAEQANDKTKFTQDEHKYAGFKDFVDSFANKFGAENQKKDSKYAIKKNQDNGDRRKGFHKVYHKDEYQEDNEFYNNKNTSALSEAEGSSNTHIGGTEGLLSSHTAALLGNQLISANEEGDTANKNVEHKHKGHDYTKVFDGNFNRYRDLAKKAAKSNSVDYSDNYTI